MRFIFILSVGLVLIIFTGCSPKYTPSPDGAFSSAKSFADDELATAKPEPILNPGCEHHPEWYRISVQDQGNNIYLVRGKVVVGNVYCVKDESEFSATVYYDFEDEFWHILGDVSFSNPCVLYRTYRSIPDHCFSSRWEGP